MMTSAELFKTPLLHSNRLAWVFALVSFVGFSDATYLTLNHYWGIPLVCSVLQGCERVTTSPYATIVGVPVALLGAAYYLAMFFLSVHAIDTKQFSTLRLMACLSIVGALASLWLVFAQVFLIQALCLYCLVSAVTSFTLLALGVVVFRRSS